MTSTPTNTATANNTVTYTLTNTFTNTATQTVTSTFTNLSTNTSTETKTATNTNTNTVTNTFTVTRTATNTPIPTATNTPNTSYVVSTNLSVGCASPGSSLGVTFVFQDVVGTYDTLHYAIAFSSDNTPSSSDNWVVGGNGAGNCPAGGTQISTGSTGLVTVANTVTVPSGFTSGYVIIEAQVNVGSLGCGTNTGGTADAISAIAFGDCTATPTKTYTITNTPTNTFTVTNTRTKTNTLTPTASSTNTNTFTVTYTPTITSTKTYTNTPTLTAPYTSTPTFTYTPTVTFTFTATVTFTNTSAANACSNFADWSAASVSYSVGTTVVYGTDMYKCIQAHTSNSGWAPPSTTSLWQDVGACTGPTSTPGPLNCSNAPAWSSNSVSYVLGAQVIYNNVLYQCIQAHTSNTAWTPSTEPTLWQNQGSCSSVPGPMFVLFSRGVTNTPTSISTQTPTPTATQTATYTAVVGGLVRSVVAAPNISRDRQPIQIQVVLSSSANIHLSIYNVLGGLVYQETIEGNAGLNNLTWFLRNKLNESVSSGLYIYVVQVNDGFVKVKKTGKVVLLR